MYSQGMIPGDFPAFGDWEPKNQKTTQNVKEKEHNGMMKRKNGFFVLLGNNEETKFEGIIVCMHDSLDETIQIKKGFYDNSNGQYVQKDLLIVDYLKGTGIVELKEFLTKIATEKLNCGIQMPELAITQEAMDFIEK